MSKEECLEKIIDSYVLNRKTKGEQGMFKREAISAILDLLENQQ